MVDSLNSGKLTASLTVPKQDGGGNITFDKGDEVVVTKKPGSQDFWITSYASGERKTGIVFFSVIKDILSLLKRD